MQKGGYRRDLHHDKTPQVYTTHELQRKFSATRFFDTWVEPRELYAKNPSAIHFKKFRGIPTGKRKSAHPQARVVRGWFGQYPNIQRETIDNKPSMILRFRYGYNTDKEQFMFAQIDRRTKIVVENVVVRERREWRFEVVQHPSGELSFKVHKAVPALSYCQAYFTCNGNMIALGDTPLIAVASDPKQAVADLLGLPLFWYKGFLYSAHDVYKTKRRRGKNKSGIHFAMPYGKQGTRPQTFVEKFDHSHVPSGAWAWQYWDA